MLQPRWISAITICTTLVCGGRAKGSTQTLQGHTPPFTQTAQDLGKEDGSKPITLRIWLKHRQASQLNSLVANLQDPTSARFGHFLSKKEVENKFHPAAADVTKVKNYLRAKGFKNIKVSPTRRFLTAQTTIAQAQNIFHVEMHKYAFGKDVVTANSSDPAVDSEIADKVAFIGGLSHHTMKPYLRRQTDLDTGAIIEPRPFKVQPLKASTYETVCFGAPETDKFLAADGMANAAYTGNRYGASILAPSPNSAPCGYGPKEVQAAYGIDKLIQQGLDGSGQTIVIVDAYGSPTAQADLAAFSQSYGLPPPHLTIYQPSGIPVTGTWNADQQGWAGETTLDIEYAHTFAPNAKIALVEAMSPSDDDLNAAIAYAVDNNLGSQISNSWGGNEASEDQAGITQFNNLAQTAIAKGISVHVSSGDDGDMVTQLGFSDVGFPSSSPYVTSVGGTALALNSDLSVQFHAGWGNNGMRVADGATSAQDSVALKNAPLAPPTKLGFMGGAGGGASRVFPKPDYQKKIRGTGRMQPDIAYLADPFTGVEIVQSTFDSNGNPQSGNLTVSVIGGTSLACPMFTGMWAIANQAHQSPLGQAAPLLYQLPKNAIIDVQPVTSDDNVTGTLTDAKGNTTEMSAIELALPETSTPFLSAIYNSPFSPYRWNVLSFGTDSSLAVTKGWDNVTGLGVPNGEDFVSALSN